MGRVAKVFVQNLNAGIIRETDYGYEFSYIEEYLDRKDSVPVSLTLPLSHEIYQSNTLFPFFDGLIPESEFLLMKMADIAGIKVVPNALVFLDGKYAYITKRIDRYEGRLYAMEDFCQLSGRMTADKYRSSYESCGKVIRKYSKNIGLDMTEFYYRLLFCFLTGNSDMHLKNFSLIEEGPGNRIYSLSAAYDMLPVNVIMPEDKEQMALTLNGKKSNLKKNDFIALASNLEIREKVAYGMIKQMLKYKKIFKDVIDISYVSDEMKERLKDIIDVRAEVLS